jgi:hypothetical protein
MKHAFSKKKKHSRDRLHAWRSSEHGTKADVTRTNRPVAEGPDNRSWRAVVVVAQAQRTGRRSSPVHTSHTEPSLAAISGTVPILHSSARETEAQPVVASNRCTCKCAEFEPGAMMRELEEQKDSPANVCGRGEADMCLNLKLCVLYLCDRWEIELYTIILNSGPIIFFSMRWCLGRNPLPIGGETQRRTVIRAYCLLGTVAINMRYPFLIDILDRREKKIEILFHMPYSSPDTAAAANGLDRSPVVMPYSSPDTACVWRSLRPDQRRSELKMSHSDSIVQFRLNLYWAHHSYVSAPCKTFTYGL